MSYLLSLSRCYYDWLAGFQCHWYGLKMFEVQLNTRHAIHDKCYSHKGHYGYYFPSRKN